MVCTGTELYPGLVVPKIYMPGLGYSAASGPQVGGSGLGPADAGGASPYKYSSTFFGSGIKQLFPGTFQFSSRRMSRKRRASKRRASKKRVSKRKVRRASKKKTRR